MKYHCQKPGKTAIHVVKHWRPDCEPSSPLFQPQRARLLMNLRGMGRQLQQIISPTGTLRNISMSDAPLFLYLGKRTEPSSEQELKAPHIIYSHTLLKKKKQLHNISFHGCTPAHILAEINNAQQPSSAHSQQGAQCLLVILHIFQLTQQYKCKIQHSEMLSRELCVHKITNGLHSFIYVVFPSLLMQYQKYAPFNRPSKYKSVEIINVRWKHSFSLVNYFTE